MFTERPKAQPKVELISAFSPYLVISNEALGKMQIYVQECSDEIGWLGTIEQDQKDRDLYYLTDVYLFKQQVHATTTEITSEGLSNFAEEILQLPDGIDIWNSIRAWGHSHVNMGISPSGQDDKQMEEFKAGGHPYFFRIIANKKGDMKIDLYDYSASVAYKDIPWVRELTEQEYQLQQQIEALEKIVEENKKNSAEAHRHHVKEEMKQKVSKLVTTFPTSNWHQNWYKKTEPIVLSHDAKTQEVKDDMGDTYWDEEFIIYNFTDQDLWVFTTMSFEEIEEELEVYGYHHTEFTREDVKTIKRVAEKHLYQKESDPYGTY